ncbi:ankyrin [Ascodesmis nigricans]|uniref:Ankyrin n=1 Tax=Ascodesmis nigricans TaxID=341454 RepID=A0A4S2MVF8_9PEZI|nr:ankyrin [Ascodesmis nigricans]
MGAPGELIIFQKFATYQADHHMTPITALVLILVSDVSRRPRLVIHDQNWRCLVEILDFCHYEVRCEKNIVILDSHRITLSTALDAVILYIMSTTFGQLAFVKLCEQGRDLATYYALWILITLDIKAKSAVEYLLNPKTPILRYIIQDDERNVLYLNTVSAAQNLSGELGVDPVVFNCYRRSIVLSSKDQYAKLTLLLLEKMGVEVFADSEDADCFLILRNSILKDRIIVFKLWLENGESVDQSIDGSPLLCIAAGAGVTQIARLLLDDHNNSLVNGGAYKSDSSLPKASQENQSNLQLHGLVQWSTVDVNVRDASGRTALSYAAGDRHDDVVQLLLQQPTVHVNVRDIFGRAALSYAAENGHGDVVRMLLGRIDVDAA